MLSLLIAPAPAFALFNVSQGGIGVDTFPFGAFLFGNGTSPIGTTYAPSFSFVNATTTNATSTFSGGVSVLGRFNSGLMSGNVSALSVDSPTGDVSVNTDLRMGDGAGGIVFTDFPFTTEWSHFYGFGPDQIALQKPTGGAAVLDFAGIGGEQFFTLKSS